MNKAVPWSIKGVGFDARDAAKEAARRAGMTLGEWLNSVIAEQASELGVDADSVDESDRLDAVAERLARMSSGEPVGRSVRVPRQSRLIDERFSRAAEELRAHRPEMRREIRRSRDVVRESDAETLLERAIQALEKGTRRQAERTSAALLRVADRLEDIEDRLDARIYDEEPEQAYRAPVRETARPSDGFGRLERKLSELIDTLAADKLPAKSAPHAAASAGATTQAISRPAAAGPPRAPVRRVSIADAVAQITRRQGELRDPDDLAAPATRAPAVDVSGLEREISALSTRLDETRRDLIERDERRQSAARARASEPDGIVEISQLRRQIEELSRGFARLASRETVVALDAAMRDLTVKVQESRDGGIAESVIRPVEELAAEIRRSLANLPVTTSFQFIEKEIAAVRQRLAEMQTSEFDPRILVDLQSQITEIRAMLSQALARPATLDNVEKQIAGLADRVDLLSRHGGSPIDSAAVIQSIGEVRETLERALPTGFIVQIGSRIDALAQRLEAVALAPPAVDRLSERIELLGRKIDDAVSQSSASDQLDQLSERLDLVQRSLVERPETPSAPVDTSRLEAIVRDLSAKLERPAAPLVLDNARLESLVGELAEKLGGKPAPDLQQVDALRGEIARLAQQLERIAPAIDARRIESMVSDLAGKLESAGAPVGDLQLADALAHQIADLGARMDTSSHALDMRVAEELRAEMARLADRIEAGQERIDNKLIEEIRREISGLSERLQVGDESARVLASLETAVTDIFSRLDDIRHATIDAAELTARTVARDTARDALETQAQSPGLASEQITRELLDLRSMHDVADRRTHATLTAVHDTLEKIVDRLAMLEEDVAEVRPEPLALPPRMREPALPPAPGENLLASGPAPSFVRPGQKTEVENTIAPKGLAPTVMPDQRRAEAAATTVDALIEPGSGVPASRRPPEQSPEQPDERSKQASFIAAARRAAKSPAKADGNTPSDPMAAALERAKAAHIAALEKTSTGGRESDSGSLLARLRNFINGHQRAILVGLIGIASVVVSLQAMRFLRTEAPRPAIVEYSPSANTSPAPPAPAGVAPAAPAVAPASPAPEAPAPQKQGALQTPGKPVAGAFSQAHVDLSLPQKFAPGGSAVHTDPMPTGSISPAPAVPSRLTLAAAAGAGQANAQFELASRLADGRGMARDPEQARQWFEKAALQKLAPAEFRLGAINERGIGVERDLKRAHDFYLRAANAGNVRAMHNLAVLSAEGVDGKPDYVTAAAWFQKAAEFGVRDSQYNLAILLARGLGVSQNLQQSWIWFAAAASQGDSDAEKKRDEVGARLGSVDLAAARASFQAFHPATPLAAANDVPTPPGGWDQAEPRAEPVPARAPVRGKVSSL